jgi:hypothetical protein
MDLFIPLVVGLGEAFGAEVWTTTPGRKLGDALSFTLAVALGSKFSTALLTGC